MKSYAVITPFKFHYAAFDNVSVIGGIFHVAAWSWSLVCQYSCLELDYPFFIYTVTNYKTNIFVLVSFGIFKEASSSLDDCDTISSGEIIQTICKPTGL